MNKSELVTAVAEKSGLKRKDAADAVDALVDTIREELSKGGEVSIIGFGAFGVKERAERIGRNPRTSEPLTIPAGRAPVFKAGKALKDALGE
ncbi:MAG: HU family DNA-binding protein [Armatimonadetes bacterium]|nr:HU family DNA-binding protein [Armatimonadota bacterium]